MKEASITFNIVFNEDDVIERITAKMSGSLDCSLFANIIESVDKVRDEYNKEKQNN